MVCTWLVFLFLLVSYKVGFGVWFIKEEGFFIGFSKREVFVLYI